MAEDVRALAEEIWEMTSALRLTGQPELAEQEITAFASLMEKREPLIEKLTRRLEEQTQGSLDEDDTEDINRLVSMILTLDKEHQQTMEHIRAHVVAAIKEVHSGQKVNTAYAHPMDAPPEGGAFDAKQ